MPHPADVLKLKKNWKLNTPLHKKAGSTKIKGDSKEVEQSDLATFEDPSCFFVTGDGKGVVMRAHHGDPTTDNSDNPRCELREVADGGDWKGSHGTHTLTVVGQVNRLTAVTKKVVLAQVHGKHDDVTVFLLQGDKLCIKDGDHVAFTAPKPLPLRTRYTLKIEVSGGKTRYWFNDDHPLDFTLTNDDPANYFKAGNYLQSNPKKNPSESTSEFSEVVLYSVTTSHDD